MKMSVSAYQWNYIELSFVEIKYDASKVDNIGIYDV